MTASAAAKIIGGADVDKRRVNERLRQLEFEHIEFVFDRMAEKKYQGVPSDGTNTNLKLSSR